MATIWYMREGEEQRGSSIAEKSLDWCVENLRLEGDRRIADLTTRPLIVGRKDPMSPFRNQLVVVEVKNNDCQGSFKNWRPGYYLLEKRAEEVQKILGGND